MLILTLTTKAASPDKPTNQPTVTLYYNNCSGFLARFCAFAPASETHRGAHPDQREVRVGGKAVRRRVQEFGLAARGRHHVVEGQPSDQAVGQECKYEQAANSV